MHNEECTCHKNYGAVDKLTRKALEDALVGYTLQKYTFENILGNRKLLVIAFRKYMTSRDQRTLCNGPEPPTQWKSESVTNGPAAQSNDQLTEVVAGDAFVC